MPDLDPPGDDAPTPLRPDWRARRRLPPRRPTVREWLAKVQGPPTGPPGKLDTREEVAARLEAAPTPPDAPDSDLPAIPPEVWAAAYDAAVAEATWHGMVLDSSGTVIIAAISSCDEHKPNAEQSADYIHEMSSVCGLPGSMFTWPENYCSIPDDQSGLAGVVAEPCAVSSGGGQA